jgi:hypothetical protein
MSHSQIRQRVELRLQRRAAVQALGPLLNLERAQNLRDQMRDTAHRESFSRVRRQRSSFILGLAAAALLMLAVPEFLALRIQDFGARTTEVAMLDSGGRVVQGMESLRSADSERDAEGTQPVFLELYVEEEAHIGVRVQTKAGWQQLPQQEDVELSAGEDALIQLPPSPPATAILIITSTRPIPEQVLDENLRRFGWRALPERLGCTVQLHRLGAPDENPASD